MVQLENTSRMMLEKYFGNLFPFNLEADEYICLFYQKDEKIKFNRFYKDIESIIADIENYKHIYDVYVALSTVKGNADRTAENAYRRASMVFDFDFKDYANNDDVNYYIYSKFKATFTRLYSPYVVKSGHGVHIYCFTEPTTNIKQLTDLNREMAEMMGADTRACLTTQVIRIPASYNHKLGDKKLVIEYFDKTGEDNFKRDTLTKLKNILKQSKPKEVSAEVPHRIVDLTTFKKLKPCTEQMLKSEVHKGQRNFVLGRIVADFKRIGHTKEQVRDIVLTWNKEHCVPSKSDKEVLTDLNNYWKADYKLLGCTIGDSSKQAILDNFCDKHNCNYLMQRIERRTEFNGELLAMNNRWLKSELLKEFNGRHYVVISLLLRSEKHGMTIKELEQKLQPIKKKDKAVIGIKLLRTMVKELESKGIVRTIKPSNPNQSIYVELKDVDKTYGTGYTTYLHVGAIMAINKLLTPRQLTVYLAIARLRGQGEVNTLNRLHEITGLAERTISTEMKVLLKLDLLGATEYYDNKGILRTRLNIVA